MTVNTWAPGARCACVFALAWLTACRVYDPELQDHRSAQAVDDSGPASLTEDAGKQAERIVDADAESYVDASVRDGGDRAPHARIECDRNRCVLTACLDRHRDCDGRADTGCEIAPDDTENCGGCGRTCELLRASARCDGRRCLVDACEDGFGDCDADGSSCETRLDSVEHCGACGQRCPTPPHATPSCTDETCAMGRCDNGYADCNGLAEDGCEQALDTMESCGGCGVRCHKASCRGGVCRAVDCSERPGFADCDGDEASCEVDLRSDVEHCGGCDRACRFTSEEEVHAALACRDGSCRAVCERGFGDCDGDPGNGCERSLSALTSCGSCDRACAIEDATESCADLRCEVLACHADVADCDGDRASCETRLDTLEHCGDCLTRCELRHARAVCSGQSGARSCTIGGCEPGWANCDGLAANGCERDVRPVGSGGEGPCLPDVGCKRASRDGHDYYVCPTARSWHKARSLCRSQAGGDLADIGSAAEASFIQPLLPARCWIGHDDTMDEGLWIWAPTGVRFWRGRANGRALDGQYAAWSAGEPNGSGDCGAIYPTGLLDDLTCTRQLPFVCKISPDR